MYLVTYLHPDYFVYATYSVLLKCLLFISYCNEDGSHVKLCKSHSS